MIGRGTVWLTPEQRAAGLIIPTTHKEGLEYTTAAGVVRKRQPQWFIDMLHRLAGLRGEDFMIGRGTVWLTPEQREKGFKIPITQPETDPAQKQPPYAPAVTKEKDFLSNGWVIVGVGVLVFLLLFRK